MNTKLNSAICALGVLGSAGLAAAEVNQPIEIIDRSRTLPAGELEASATVTLQHVPVGDGDNVTTLGLAAGYGINKKLEARLGYGFGLDPSSSQGPLSIGAAYDLVSISRFTAAADAFIGYDFGPDHSLPLQLGIEAQLKLTAKLAVFTPGHQLAIGLEDNNPVGLHLPIGVGYQATRNIFADVQTEIAYLAFHDGGGTTFGSDTIPLRLELFYSLSNIFDLGVSFSDELKNAGDFYQFGAVARVFL